MKKIFLMLIALVLSISAFAETVTISYDSNQSSYYSHYGTLSDSVSEVYFYRYGTGDYRVTAIVTPNASITIPDSISYNGTVYPVTNFGYSSNYINVSLAQNLTEIHLPTTITCCDGYLPYQITSLYLTSPQVIDFYRFFFGNMNSALEIVVSESLYNSYYTSFTNSSDSYTQNAASHLIYERTVQNVYTITVNTPGTMAQQYFNVATAWNEVDELTVIGSIDESDMKWFSRMTNLSKLDLLQTSITTIKGCHDLRSLKTVLLPSTVTSVSDSAFMNCYELDSLLIPNTITSIGDYAFYYCSMLSNVPLQNVKKLGAYALCNIYYQNSVLTMPELTSMGRNAFDRVFEHAPSGNYYLDSLCLPKLTVVPSHAFSNGYTYISNIVLPSAISIGSYAFQYNGTVSSVDIPAVTYIDNYAFYDCEGLSHINLPSVQTIGQDAFQGCTNLSSVNMPSIQYIYAGAFDNCPIDTLVLPASIRQIRGSNYSYSLPFNTITLTDVYCYASVPFTTTAFSSVSATLHVPSFALNSYRMHDSWAGFPSIVPIDTLCDELLITEDFTLTTMRGLVAKPSIYVQNYNGNLTINTDTIVRLNNFYQSFDSPQFAKYRDGGYAYGNDKYYDIEGSCTPTIINDTVTADNVFQDIFMRPGYWNFVSLPFDVDVADIIVPDSTNWIIRRYSGADRASLTGNSWQNMTETMTLNANEGYIIHCQSVNSSSSSSSYSNFITFRFTAKNNANKNKIFANGNVTLPLNKYAADRPHNANWNMVGNPYPCFFNSSSIQHDGIITVWNGNGYTAYSLIDDSYTLLPGEAFFVQCPNNASSMTFLANGRSKNYTAPAISYAPALFAEDNSRKVYNLTLTMDSLSDHTRFVINPSSSVDYELSCDASKFAGNTSVPDFYMVENEEHLAINERPMASGIFELGFNAKIAGNYTIALQSNPDQTTIPYITDKQTGVRQSLENSPYTFYTAAGTFDGRFIITFNEVPAGIDNTVSDSDFVESGDVYSLDGRFVMHFENRSETDNLAAGTYVLRSGNVTEKFIKK